MTIAVGQTAKGTSTGNLGAGDHLVTTGPPVTSSASGSSFLIACIYAVPGGSVFVGVSDSKSNTYTQVGTTINFGLSSSVALYLCQNGTGGSSHTATMTFSGAGSTYVTVFLVEITGGATSGITDQTGQGTDAATPFTSPAITTTQASELLISVFGSNAATGTSVLTPGNSFTTTIQENNADLYMDACLMQRVVSSIGTYNTTLTDSLAPTSTAQIIAAFRDAGGAGFSPATASLVLTGQQPILLGNIQPPTKFRRENRGFNKSMFPSFGTLVITGQAPVASVPAGPQLRQPSFGSLTIAGQAPNPAISSASFTHGTSQTITGSGFGSKTGVTQIWDNCSGSNPLALWDGVEPTTSGAPYNMAYSTPAALGRGVALPHTNVTQYMRGCHNPATIATNGNQVVVFHNFTKTTFPYYIYWHWYRRYDPNWTFGASGDNNNKFYGYSTGFGTVYGSAYWYIDYKNNDTAASTPWATFNDDGVTFDPPGSLTNPDQNGHGWSWGSFTSPTTAWHKFETLAKLTNTTTGYIKLWENGNLEVDYAGRTDNYSVQGTQRCTGIEGYSGNGNDGVNNWRFLNDIAMMHGPHIGRFILANNATYASATVVEYQPYTSWSDTSVTITVNKGALSTGTVHLHYRDEVNGHQYIGVRTVS